MKKRVKEYLLVTAGTAVAVAGLKLFLVPSQIAAGGVSGIATILYYTLNLPIGTVMLALNIPLFLIGAKWVGRAFLFKSLYATVLFSALSDLVNYSALATDNFLSTIYGGALMGVGLGVVIRAGGSTGGTDIAAIVLNKKFKAIGVSSFVFIVDFFIIAAAGMVFDVISALYAIASVYISSKAIEFITDGISSAKAFMIITDKSSEICDMIINKLERGATIMDAYGAYSRGNKKIVLCVLERTGEQLRLKESVRAVDGKAFIISYAVKEVLGEGFAQ